MKDNKLQESITMTCPNGHRLRGNSGFVGKSVKCPRCQSVFVISAPDNKRVTDTSVMRILGEGPSGPISPPDGMDVETRPCPRCGLGIARDSAVCPHCKCYIGVMPRYMSDMVNGNQVGHN